MAARKKAKKKAARKGRTTTGRIKAGYYLDCKGVMRKKAKKKARR